jgi:hypothetical protein
LTRGVLKHLPQTRMCSGVDLLCWKLKSTGLAGRSELVFWISGGNRLGGDKLNSGWDNNGAIILFEYKIY